MKLFVKSSNEEKMLHLSGDNTYIIDKDFMKQNKQFIVFCDTFNATLGEKGFYLLPPNIRNAGAPLIRFSNKQEGETTITSPLLSFFGVSNKDFCGIVYIDRGYVASYKAKLENGKYTLCVYFDLTNQLIDRDMTIKVIKLLHFSDYNAMAKKARDYYISQRVPTLRERCQNRSAVDYARRHPLIRIRMGWKPVPPNEIHQTLDNEPEMYVACTFKRVREIADELKKQGIEGAEISLVGWNVRGHDGRWPQIFPVDEALGGEKELKKTIEHCVAYGYVVSCHTNSMDHYEIADSFSYDNLTRKADGSTVTSGNWAGGVSLRACPKVQLEYAKQDLPKVEKLGFKGLHYIDVLSIVDPDSCFSEEHPCSARETISCFNEIMKLSSELFGGFSSEGCMDFTYKHLDFSLYNTFKLFPGTVQGITDENIPLVELVTHGLLLSNQSSETVNYSIKEKENFLTAILFCCRPTFYFYSKFFSDGSAWMGLTDLTCDTDEQLRVSVSAIKRAIESYTYFAKKQFIFMDRFVNHGNGVYEIAYEDGDRILVNYSHKDTVVDGVKLAAQDYIILS